ncbi:MAG: SurA N-terminal domain-containing protein [Endomicrobium sp.]|jgi:hypothetical protein|nr:SurA N-terminal domain-containing protein [Endomicrobium sp.]
MMNFLRKHMRKIFIITILGFLAGIFMGFGSYFFQKEDYRTAATVNGAEISINLFNSIYLNSLEMARRGTEEVTEEMIHQLKIKTLQALIQDEVFYQQSLNYGILVSDLELKRDIQESLLFRNNNNVFDINMYYRFLQTIKMKPKEYEALRKKEIAVEKTKVLLASSVKLMEQEYDAAVKADAAAVREMILNMKINTLLNEWYQDTIKNYKISSSEFIFVN